MVGKVPKLPLAAVLAVIVVFSVPLVYLAVMAFTAPAGYYAGQVRLALINLRLLADPEFLHAMMVSIIAAGLGAVLSLFLILSAAYGFYLFYSPANPLLPRAGRVVLGAFLLLLVFNGGIVPLYLLVRYLGMVDSLAALFVPYLLHPLLVLYCLEQLRKIPPSLLEAGRLEGAGELTILARIIFPMKRRFIGSVLIVQFVLHWNNWYPGVLFIHTPARRPVQVFLRDLLFADQGLRNLGMSRASYSPPERMAFVFFSVLPVLAAFTVLILINRSRRSSRRRA